jgi:hypothetical protein
MNPTLKFVCEKCGECKEIETTKSQYSWFYNNPPKDWFAKDGIVLCPKCAKRLEKINKDFLRVRDE